MITHRLSAFEKKLLHQAALAKKTIVLAEGESLRVLKAAEYLGAHKIASIIVLGNKKKVQALAKKYAISPDYFSIVDPAIDKDFTDYAKTLYELRKDKGWTKKQAVEAMKDVSYFGTMMVYKKRADGMVSGAEHTTAHTIRPALQFIKPQPPFNFVSGAFIMTFEKTEWVFADCGVMPQPTPEQLADIAQMSAQTARLIGLRPRVAFLSYATGASAEGPCVDAVRTAVEIAHKKYPQLVLDGPMQFDAAVNRETGQRKLPDSLVAGRANVFVFPDLNAGNCCYKAVQQTTKGCLALGPLLQGLKKPVNDLSRGATIPDIINTVAFTALSATQMKE